ncbi:MAG: DUF1800 family protein [Pseudomonadota bacterium]
MQLRPPPCVHLALMLVLLALTAGCNSSGGSGGSGGRNASPGDDTPVSGETGGTDPVPSTPSVSAPARTSVDEGSAKAVDFSAGTSDGGELAMSLAGPDASRLRIEGQSVLFIDAPDFEAPLSADTRYVFEIIAATADATARASVTVEVEDVLEARVIDGPVANAIVFVDLDADGVLDVDEPSTLSDESGYARVPDFAPQPGITPRLVATDGVDTFTGLRLEGLTMVAKIEPDSTETFMVTPLSSLLAHLDDDAQGDLLLGAMGVETAVGTLRTLDVWEATLAGDAEAAALLQQMQQLAFTLKALRRAALAPDADPRTSALLEQALQRRLGEQLIGGALLDQVEPLTGALTSALTDLGIEWMDDVPISDVAEAVADVNSLLASAEARPISSTGAAILAVVQADTARDVGLVRTGQMSPEQFAVAQREAFSEAVRRTQPDAPDTDQDGMLDSFDRDDDNDGVDDVDDAFPLDPTRDSAPPPEPAPGEDDLDGDGIPDVSDADDDGDGVDDVDDANPRDGRVSAPANLTTEQRFKLLSMGTFGATPTLMADLERLGPEGWVEAQLATPSAYDSPSDEWPTHLERTIEIAEAFAPDIDFFTVDSVDGSIAFNERTAEPLVRRFQMAAWNDNAFGSIDHPLVGTDPLRQRMAYALSQLLVTSTSTPPLDQRGESLAYFYDLLARHAFGNYRDLLGDVARSPTMGTFLSHAGNKKASAQEATRPDENFARELVQLFTLGLYALTPNGEAAVDGEEVPVPAYTQTDIEELAKVMTGWNLAGSRSFRGPRTGDGDHTRAMVFDPAWHEDELDPYYDGQGDGEVVLLGQRIALDADDRTLDGDGNSTRSGLDASLDALFTHPNVAPYIAKHLIAHFVTANPSPQYVARVADVFTDDGTGVRGNLGAVLKAILLDRDAYAEGTAYSKIKEPLLAYTQLLRALDVAPVPSGFMSNKGGVPITEVNIYYEGELDSVIGYAPMRAESVFNFFDPDFTPPDTDLTQADLLAPEMVMMTDQYYANVANLVLSLANTREFVRFDRSLSSRRVLSFSNGRVYDVNFTAPLIAMELAMEGDSNMDFASINLEDEQGNQPYKAVAVDALVDWVDERLFGDSLPTQYREALAQHLREGMHKGEKADDPPEVKADKRFLEAWELVRDALVMATAMPAYMVQ